MVSFGKGKFPEIRRRSDQSFYLRHTSFCGFFGFLRGEPMQMDEYASFFFIFSPYGFDNPFKIRQMY